MIRFYKEQQTESSEEIPNPGVGWYHLYTWHIAPPYPNFFYIADENEKLVLLLMDIGEFRFGPLPDEALCCIGEILEFYHANKKQMILRFVYDAEGKCTLKEPSDSSLVKTHIRQVGSVLKKYKDSIACIQGIFVGNWGEMHGSRYLSDDVMTELIEELDSAVGKGCFLAVRKPSQRRTAEKYAGDSSCVRRIGLFNDGMFGSQTDLGTYQELGREQELNWQRENMRNTYNGGEALVGEKPIGYSDAVKDLQRMHISYLNSVYQKEQLLYWKSETVWENGCWDKISGYDYIGRHLGYRFVVRDVRLDWRKKLTVLIENVGFANLCKEADCFLTAEDMFAREESVEIKTDARSWDSGKISAITADSEEISALFKESGEYRLSIRLCLRNSGEVIRFANRGAEESCQLGTVRAL